MNNTDALKEFYSTYSDSIIAKRAESPYPLRRYVHYMQYESVVQHVRPGMRVLDAGCGEGVLSVLAAKRGAIVVGCDISEPNIAQAKLYAAEHNVEVTFLVADAEQLPFPDQSFDLVLSSHVLEHLPDFDAGVRELLRVTRGRAIVALPSLPGLCSMVQVGGGWFYIKGLRSFAGFIFGFARTVVAFLLGREGVDETYAGQGVPHVFRFPWRAAARMRSQGAAIVSYEASSLCLPYFTALLPLGMFLDRFRDAPVLRNFGYGTTFVIEKNKL